VVGDLLDAPEPVIAHGVNTLGKFGAGVAAQVAARWPEAREAYLRKFRHEGWALGEVQMVPVPGKLLVNLATQASIGRTGRHVDYDAVRTCFSRLFVEVEGLGLGVALPRIGAGLGGGEWAAIEDLLYRELVNRGVEVTVYSPPPPGRQKSS